MNVKDVNELLVGATKIEIKKMNYENDMEYASIILLVDGEELQFVYRDDISEIEGYRWYGYRWYLYREGYDQEELYED